MAVQPARLRKKSRVVREPVPNNLYDFTLRLSQYADGIPAWGSGDARTRDTYLRSFLPTEPILETAFYSMCVRYACLGWKVTGPQRMATISRNLLHSAQFGQGWLPMMLRVTQDLFGCDNGAFIEINRVEDDPRSPVIGLNHLDSGRCIRTGRDDYPVHYLDSNGDEHKLAWYQVIALSEFPSPIENARGGQVCAVSRVLRAAQVMKEINTYKRQKISGKNIPGIWLVGGVTAAAVKAAMKEHLLEQETIGNSAYLEPAIIGSRDPNATVSSTLLELASLPPGFDEEVTFRLYLIVIANAWAVDYQDFAPMPGGNLGSGHQSQILDRKSRQKGPALYMQLMEHALNWHGVIPATVSFSYGEQDMMADTEQAKLAVLRSQERKNRIESGEITLQVAAQRALDVGDLEPEEFHSMGYQDLTDDVTLASSKELVALSAYEKIFGGGSPVWMPHFEVGAVPAGVR